MIKSQRSVIALVSVIWTANNNNKIKVSLEMIKMFLLRLSFGLLFIAYFELNSA